MLGNHFPEELQSGYISKNISPTHVFYLYCDFIKPPKDKYLLLASCESELLFFMINSEINQFIQKNENMCMCQVFLDAHNHLFLSHDSYINCAECIDSEKISLEILKNQLSKDISRIKGRLSHEAKNKVILAVKNAKTIALKRKSEIINAMEKTVE